MATTKEQALQAIETLRARMQALKTDLSTVQAAHAAAVAEADGLKTDLAEVAASLSALAQEVLNS